MMQTVRQSFFRKDNIKINSKVFLEYVINIIMVDNVLSLFI